MCTFWFAKLPPATFFYFVVAQIVLVPSLAAWVFARAHARGCRLRAAVSGAGTHPVAAPLELPSVPAGRLTRWERYGLVAAGLALAGGWFAILRSAEPDRALCFTPVASFPIAGQQPGDALAVLEAARSQVLQTIQSAPDEVRSFMGILVVDFKDAACAKAARELLGGGLAEFERSARGVEVGMMCCVSAIEQLRQPRPDIATALTQARAGYPILVIAAGQIAIFKAD